MKKQIFVMMVLILCFSRAAFAQPKASNEDKIISATFKTLAKAFVATTDIEKLKKKNIDKLNKMDEEKFKKKYAETYKIIKDLPAPLKTRYGIIDKMTKEHAVRNIHSLDKKKTYEIIDAIPDAIIAREFKESLEKEKEQMKNSNVVEQIQKSWNRMISEMNKVEPAS
ncbi:MAG: hypothetical protein NUV91_10155 [Candidatus Omnitrophica bacterium]|nr:hypothetical protein [Candidatus Omnitrophota bacterium]